MKITSLKAFQIYDSRGFPTVECHLELADGSCGVGIVPSGASTGQFEAWELRDGDVNHLQGKSVLKAISNIEDEIAAGIKGMDAFSQEEVDQRMILLDGTANKSRLGANAILGVSMAVANAAANSSGKPLFDYLGKGEGTLLPLPEIQLIGGGAHAAWRTDIQDFLLMAIGAKSYAETLEMTFNVYHTAGRLLKEKGNLAGIADEGGYWPSFSSHEEIFSFVIEAIAAAGYEPGVDLAISLDVAASDLYNEKAGVYRLPLDKAEYSPDEFITLQIGWCDRFPVVSIEDPLADTDWKAWKRYNETLGNRLQIIGDDLFTTNTGRIQKGIQQGVANSVLIKLNQIGTVSETIEAIRQTQAAGWNPVVSARSGETEDAFISHLAVATNAGQLKVGSFARSERMVKWNEVLRIEHQLGERAEFKGGSILQ
ncbi:phosphopyruvate hydratase [Opitutia bacterium ISCC 51]|nr:phosphopyruvate hydratase [Opitutae bacterium ISCC 51]QXD30018.1 phosphopyruvate hydratase [Opitutae bacterium ISCC 52]